VGEKLRQKIKKMPPDVDVIGSVARTYVVLLTLLLLRSRLAAQDDVLRGNRFPWLPPII